MDLPTYTSIWRIEKRLYKLYDIRLPMPLPMVWIVVFVGVMVPWALLLAVVGLPFETPWHVVYIVPPGVITWLSTRPVIEGKRLNELLLSQGRYLSEPKVWCRLHALEEPEQITINARTWRRSRPRVRRAPAPVPRPRAEAPRSQAPHADAPRAHAPRTDAPRAEVARPMAPRVEVARPTAPRVEVARPTAPRVEVARPTAPRVEVARPTAPRADAPRPTAPHPSASRQAAPRPAAPPPAEPHPSTSSGADKPPAAPHPAAPSPAPPSPAPPSPAAPRPAAQSPTAPDQAPPAPAPAAPAPAPPAWTTEESVPAVLSAPEPTPAPERSPAPDPAFAPEHAPAVDPVVDVASATRPVRRTAEGKYGKLVAQAVPEPNALPAGGAVAPPSALEKHRKGEPPKRTRNAQSEQPPPEPQPAWAAPAPPASPSIRVVPAPRATGEAPARNDNRRGVESVVRRANHQSGWRRVTKMIVGSGTGRPDTRDTIDETRARSVFRGSRRVMVLGCTGGAGQSTVTLELGHTLAVCRDDRILAIDANFGEQTLSDRITVESRESFGTFLGGLDPMATDPRGYLEMRAYTTRAKSGLEIIASPPSGAEPALPPERDLDKALRELDSHYKLTLVDPAPPMAARMLRFIDQLVLVAPASGDASRAVEMTLEWLDGHGCMELRRRAILVINGWSRRSIGGVERAESVASGRCRAIVRVPWDDRLGSDPRSQTRRAYLALAGVLAGALGDPDGGTGSGVTAVDSAAPTPGGR